MARMKRISVLLADDYAIVGDGLRPLLEAEEGIEVGGEAKNGRQAVELIQKLRPAMVLMDIAMPVLNGLEATRIILKTLPRTKVLILSAHSDDAYVQQATELGAAGYLLKQSSPRLLPKAVGDAQKGWMVFCPSSAKRLRDQQPKHNRSTAPVQVHPAAMQGAEACQHEDGHRPARRRLQVDSPAAERVRPEQPPMERHQRRGSDPPGSLQHHPAQVSRSGGVATSGKGGGHDVRFSVRRKWGRLGRRVPGNVRPLFRI